MRFEPLPGEASRQRVEEQFRTTKKVNSETEASAPARRAEAEKTARLRALRLLKEAAEKDAAERDAAAARAFKSALRRRTLKAPASSPSGPKYERIWIDGEEPGSWTSDRALHACPDLFGAAWLQDRRPRAPRDGGQPGRHAKSRSGSATPTSPPSAATTTENLANIVILKIISR